MKKWNLPSMLFNDDSEFEYKFEIEYDGNQVTLFTDSDFKNECLYRYTSFCMPSPAFFDQGTEEYIEVVPDLPAAIGMLQYHFTQWKADRVHAFEKMYAALLAEYNPLWNVDGVEGVVAKDTHTGSVADTHSGKDTVQASGNDTLRHTGTDTDRLSGADTVDHDITKDETIRTGSEEDANTGTDKTRRTVATFDSNDDAVPYNAEGLEHGLKITTTYNSVKDAHTLDSTDRTSYGKINAFTHGHTETTTHGKKDETTYNSTNTQVNNLSDDHVELKIRQGNIGVTKSTDLIESELKLREAWDHLKKYFIADFIRQYCIL